MKEIWGASNGNSGRGQCVQVIASLVGCCDVPLRQASRLAQAGVAQARVA